MASSSDANLPAPGPEPKPSPTMADNFRGLVQSGEAFIRRAFGGGVSGHPAPHQHQHHHPNAIETSRRQSSIWTWFFWTRKTDIMKRLHRESFADAMKLRDKQEQIENLLSLYKYSKGFPFHDVSTRAKVALDVVGALFLVENNFDQAKESLAKTGNRTGLSSSLVFESKTRHKDSMAAELATGIDATHLGEVTGRPLELTRLQYCAHINDWLSLILVPLGAHCNNFITHSRLWQDSRSRASMSGPPSFSQYHNCGAGLSVKGHNVTTTLAELIFGSGSHDSEHGGTSRITTFGQVSYEPVEEVKFSLSGIWQICPSSSRFANLGTLAIPLGSLKSQQSTPILVFDPEEPSAAVPKGSSMQSVAGMLDGEFFERSKVEGWIQAERSSRRLVQWGFSLSDTPEHELGWGLRIGGAAAKQKKRQLHMEGFLNFNLGKGAKLQPGLVYVIEGEKQTPAMVLRSSWFM